MRTLAILACLSIFAPLTACYQPLGSSSKFASVDAEEFVGTWTITLTDADDPRLVEVTDAIGAAASTFIENISGDRRDGQMRLTFPGDDDAPVLEAQVLVSGERRYLTIMRNAPDYTAPLQYTLLVEGDGDELRLLAHPTLLVWTPVEMATGGFSAASIRGAGRYLVPHVDDAIEWYDLQAVETFHEWASAVRDAG